MLQKSTCTTEISAALRPPGGLPTLFSGIVAGFRRPNTHLHYGFSAQPCADHVADRNLKLP